MPAAVSLLVASVFAHVVIGRWVPSPWLMPDLSLVGLAVALPRAPEHRVGLLLVAVFGVSLAAFSSPLPAGAAYLGAGGLLAWVTAQWDLRPPAAFIAVLMAAEALLVTAWWLIGGLPLTLPLLAGGLGKIVLTAAWWGALRWWLGEPPVR